MCENANGNHIFFQYSVDLTMYYKLQILTITLLSFFSIIQHVQSQQWQVSGDLPPSNRYDDVFFINLMVGWTVNSEGQIFRTLDGGDNWEEQLNLPFYLRSVEFINDSIGFVGTLNGVLLRTTNGGETWNQIQDSIPENINGICGIDHAGNNVYAVGFWGYPAFFIKSTDQGVSWTHTDLSAYASGLVDCYFVNENLGFVSGVNESSGAVILKTIDGGESWETVFNGKGGIEYVWKLFFVNDTLAFGAVESFDEATSIVKSTDGGDSWRQISVSNEALDIQGIGFIDENKGWVGPRHEPLYETNDSGETWYPTGLMPHINRIFKVSNDLYYASGYKVFKYDKNLTGTFVPLNPPNTKQNIKLYPNPFSDNISIHVTVDHSTNSRLDLIDLNGQLLIPIFVGRLSSGTHEFQLTEQQLNFLPPGGYQILLRTDEEFKAKKVVKN